MQLAAPTAEVILGIARDVIRHRLGAVGLSERPDLAQYPSLTQPAGCFVSLHRRDTHALRGCIGLLQSDQALIETLRGSAEAVLKDPRFVHEPITQNELPDLEMEVTVVNPMQLAASPTDFDPEQHGIFLTVGGRSGCFLPQVARETGWNREQLLSRLCTEKLGLHADAWKHPTAALQTFTAEVIGPANLQ